MVTLAENNRLYDFYSDKKNLNDTRRAVNNSNLPTSKKADLLERLALSEKRYTPHSIFNYV